MNKIINNIIILTLLTSCTITKNFDLKDKSQIEISEFYKNQDIESYLYIKDYNSLMELDKNNRLTIPQNLVFNEDGFEVLHFNDKLCANHTLEFLKKYNSKTELKTSEFNINNYLTNFKRSDGGKIDDILSSKKIRIFLNTATFGTKFNVNEEAFKIYKEFKGKYEVYIVNIDKNKEWKK